jgi:hypothetical protein
MIEQASSNRAEACRAPGQARRHHALGQARRRHSQGYTDAEIAKREKRGERKRKEKQ